MTPAGLDGLRATDLSSLPAFSGQRIGPCVGRVGKFLCIGLNYADHAAESGMALPEEPVLFSKAVSAICGPDDDAEIPRGSVKTDWEIELGVVIGKPAKYVSEADAQHLSMWLEVNDTRYQDGSTAKMHFGVARLISHLSQFMSLHPGDIISTGTPPGGRDGPEEPPAYLKAGDHIALGVEGLGTQHQTCVPA